jgi:3-isopropylmalate/(R)-2-methylmalate dehydratase small subunit
MKSIIGRVLSLYGDNISTDDMTSGKFLNRATDPKSLGEICMHDIDPDFPKRMAPGGFVAARKNFGCGSSRETAPVALKACNVQAIIADEYARIFYRNCINIGLPLIECRGITEKVELNDSLEIEFETGRIINLTKGEEYQGSPIPLFLLEKLEQGGLMEGLKTWADAQWASGRFKNNR